MEKNNTKNKPVTREKTFGPFNSCKKKQINLKGKTRELLSIYFRRAFAIFRVSFSTIFSGTGYQKKVIFLELVVKTC